MRPWRFRRFAKKVLGEDNYNAATRRALRVKVAKFVASQLKQQFVQPGLKKLLLSEASPGGFGRIDALNTGGNALYTRLDPSNFAPTNANVTIPSLWDAFQMVMGLFGGALAGLFALGIFTKRTTGAGALLGAVTSAIVLYLVQSRTDVHFFLYAIVGVLTCLVVGFFASLFLPARDKDLVGLTIYTRG